MPHIGGLVEEVLMWWVCILALLARFDAMGNICLGWVRSVGYVRLVPRDQLFAVKVVGESPILLLLLGFASIFPAKGGLVLLIITVLIKRWFLLPFSSH